jgi:hypothetical protein
MQWSEGRWAFLDHGDVPSNRSVAIIHAFAAEDGIDLVDAFAAFRAHADEPLYFAHDLHWTPAGHRLMAEVLGQALEERFSRPNWMRLTAPPEAGVTGYRLETDAPAEHGGSARWSGTASGRTRRTR